MDRITQTMQGEFQEGKSIGKSGKKREVPGAGTAGFYLEAFFLNDWIY